MSVTFNSNPPATTIPNNPPAEAADPGIPFNKMTDEQKKDFLSADLQRLQDKTDRTEEDNATMALIMRFLDNTISTSEMEQLTKLYSVPMKESNGVSTPPTKQTRPE